MSVLHVQLRPLQEGSFPWQMTLLLGSLLFTPAGCKDAGLSRDAGSLLIFGAGGEAELVPMEGAPCLPSSLSQFCPCQPCLLCLCEPGELSSVTLTELGQHQKLPLPSCLRDFPLPISSFKIKEATWPASSSEPLMSVTLWDLPLAKAPMEQGCSSSTGIAPAGRSHLTPFFGYIWKHSDFLWTTPSTLSKELEGDPPWDREVSALLHCPCPCHV